MSITYSLLIIPTSQHPRVPTLYQKFERSLLGIKPPGLQTIQSKVGLSLKSDTTRRTLPSFNRSDRLVHPFYLFFRIYIIEAIFQNDDSICFRHLGLPTTPSRHSYSIQRLVTLKSFYFRHITTSYISNFQEADQALCYYR